MIRRALNHILRPLGLGTITCDLCGDKIPLGRCMALHVFANHAGDREAS